METKTKKADLDKILKRLQAMQREVFKKGSKCCMEVRARWYRGMYIINVTAYNENKPRRELKADGGTEVYEFENFYIYSFLDEEKNEKVMKEIVEYLDLESNGQR